MAQPTSPFNWPIQGGQELRGAPQSSLLGYHPRANVPMEGKMRLLSTLPLLASKLPDNQVLQVVMEDQDSLLWPYPYFPQQLCALPPLTATTVSSFHLFSALVSPSVR